MPDSAIDWLDALNRSFNSAAQPLIAYNMERRRVAERDLLRQQQLGDDERKFKHEEQMVDLHAKSYAKELDAQQERRTKAEQKVQRDNALAAARGMGITKEQLPDDASYSDIMVAMGKSRGRRLISAAKSAASAVQAYADYRQQSAQEVMQRVTAKTIGMVTPKELKDARLSQADINRVQQDPDAVNDLIAAAIRSKNDKAVALLNRIKGDIAGNLQAEIDLAEKTNPRLTGLAENFRLAHDAYINLEKEGGYDEASGIEASQSLIKDTFSPGSRKQSGPGLPPPPPPARRQAGAPSASTAPSGSNAFQRWWYGMDQKPAYPSAPPAGVNSPALNLSPGGTVPRIQGTPADSLEALRLQSLGLPTSMPAATPVLENLNAGTNIPIDPSVLSVLKLQSMNQDAATNQNQLFPTAFPLLSVPNR